VDAVPDFELGGAEELAVGLGGQQAGQRQEILGRRALEGLENPLGFGLLVGSKGRSQISR
jgi:hypothetical protein